jgi:hypothetical protein
VLHEPHLFVAIVAGMAFLVWEAYHAWMHEPPSTHGDAIAALQEADRDLSHTTHTALGWLMVMNIAMAIDLYRKSRHDRRAPDMGKSIQDVSESIQHSKAEICSLGDLVDTRIRSLQSAVNCLAAPASVHPPPTTNEAYQRLFGDFEGIYLAYNPAYRLEYTPGMQPPIQLFVDRYKNNDFHEACYLFLTAEGTMPLGTFTAMMGRLSDSQRKKIRVRTDSTKFATHEPEIYIGMRHNAPVAIVGLTHLPNDHGRPIGYVEIRDEKIINQLKDDVHKAWEAQTSKPYSLDSNPANTTPVRGPATAGDSPVS